MKLTSNNLKTRTTKIIHADLKNGSSQSYLWLGNDKFAQVFKEWDFENDEGKFKGFMEFDCRVGFTIEHEELSKEQDIIGSSFGDELPNSEIIDYRLEEINWKFARR